MAALNTTASKESVSASTVWLLVNARAEVS